MSRKIVLFLAIIIAFCTSSLYTTFAISAQTTPTSESLTNIESSSLDTIHNAVANGMISYKLTTPQELTRLLGPILHNEKKSDGGMETLLLEYPNIRAKFGKFRDDNSAPFTLLWLVHNGKRINIGQDKKITLRDERDLLRFDKFWGLCGLSLVNLDLQKYGRLLESMPFDSETEWPELKNMPKGFNPHKWLEDGKNPGLGIRELHKQGINGEGIGIAIIDQPLLKEHQEYSDRLALYKNLVTRNAPVQMHGSPVCSIAVGKTCGVAPNAKLYYYSVPPWKWTDNKLWADVIDQIIELNKSLKNSVQIKVISISMGDFSQRKNFDLWKAALKRAEKNGILIVTCDPHFLKIKPLKRILDTDPDNYLNYLPAWKYNAKPHICVLTSNRTIASHKGCQVYTFEKKGGLSWAVPYLAGVAALGYQIDPAIQPQTIVDLWLKTAHDTPVGPIINPTGFVKAIQTINSVDTRLPKSN